MPKSSASCVGPSVTQYEVELGPGVKVEKVYQPAAQHRLRGGQFGCAYPFTDSPASPPIGIEIPNEDREIVHLGDVLRSDKAVGDPNPMLSGIGKASKATS